MQFYYICTRVDAKNVGTSMFLDINLAKQNKFFEKSIPMCTRLVYNRMKNYFFNKVVCVRYLV